MKKSISEIQSEVENAIGNIAMIYVEKGDKSSIQYKSNALNNLKKIHNDLDEYKNKQAEGEENGTMRSL